MDDDEAVDAMRAIQIKFGVMGEIPLGNTLAALLDHIPRIQRLKAQVMLNGLIEILGDSEQGLVSRIHNDPRVGRLLWEAANAAANSDTTSKIRVLSQVASRGVVDDAALDESRYLIEILKELQVIDIRLLLELEAPDLPPETGISTAEVLGVSAGVAGSLNAKLLRLVLVETPGMSFTGVHAQVRLSDFGRQVLELLRQHGGGDPLV